MQHEQQLEAGQPASFAKYCWAAEDCDGPHLWMTQTESMLKGCSHSTRSVPKGFDTCIYDPIARANLSSSLFRLLPVRVPPSGVSKLFRIEPWSPVFRWKSGEKAAAVHRAVPDHRWHIRKQQAGMREKLLRRSEATKELMELFDTACTQLGVYCRLKPELKHDGERSVLKLWLASSMPPSGVTAFILLQQQL